MVEGTAYSYNITTDLYTDVWVPSNGVTLGHSAELETYRIGWVYAAATGHLPNFTLRYSPSSLMPPRRKAKVLVEYDDLNVSSSSTSTPSAPRPLTPSLDRLWTLNDVGGIKTEYLNDELPLPAPPHNHPSATTQPYSESDFENILLSLEQIVGDNDAASGGVDDFGEVSFLPPPVLDEDGLPLTSFLELPTDTSEPRSYRTTVEDDPEDSDMENEEAAPDDDSRKRKRYNASVSDLIQLAMNSAYDFSRTIP